MKNKIVTFYRNCETFQEQSPAKPGQAPVHPDDLAKMEVMEMVGADLMELRGRSCLVMVDKKSGFRFCYQGCDFSTGKMVLPIRYTKLSTF